MLKRMAVILILFFLVVGGTTTMLAQTEEVYRIEISGEIDPGLAYQVEKAITEAEARDVDLVLIEIDTYGGVVDPAIRIRNSILETDLTTATYVNRRAWSAGALIALAGENLFMASGSSIGAAETRPNEEKYISAVRKEFAATAERRGRDPYLAEAMVDSDIEIEGVVNSSKLLTLTAQEALDKQLIDDVLNSRAEVLAHFNLEQARVIEIDLTTFEKFARVVTNPYISALLLVIGFVALTAEILVPGFGAGGTVGLISFGIFFSGHAVINDTGLGLVILFLVGLTLIALEAFVIPGFGIPGVGGLVAILASIFLVFPTTEIALTVIGFVLFFATIGVIITVKTVGGSKFWRNISLTASQQNKAGYVSHSQKDELLGQEGVAMTDLRPAGAVEIAGERIDVVSESSFVEQGVKVEVVKVVGNRIIVRKIFREDD